MLGVNTPQCPEFGLAALPGRERDFDAAFTRALDYVVAIGGTAIHCMTGVVPVNERPAAERVFIANMTHAAAAAAKANITLLIEPINPRDRPGYFLSHVEQAADLIGKIGAPNVRMQFDFYHVQIIGGDLIKRFEKFQPVIGHVQIAAVPTRHEPDEGEINYPAVFAAIDKLGYSRLDRLRIQAAHAHRGWPRLGQALRRRAETELMSWPTACVSTAKPRWSPAPDRASARPSPRLMRERARAWRSPMSISTRRKRLRAPSATTPSRCAAT